MNRKKSMSVISRANSFKYAFNGLRLLFVAEPNAKLHALATAVVIIAGFIKQLSQVQWLAVILAIGLVWITEALNTCIEKLCDFACGGQTHPAIKVIKDVAAAAVLIAAIVSAAVGILVFLF